MHRIRIGLLGVVGLIGLMGSIAPATLSAQVRASPPETSTDAADAPARIESLGENLHRIHVPEQPHTVMLALTGPDGALVVDFENPDLATYRADDRTMRRVREALERVGAWPVRYLIDTHWHQDHVGANEALGDDALIVAHAGTRRILSSRHVPWWLPEGIGPMAPQGLPDLVFDRALTLFLNGEEIELFHVAPAHTEGDAVVWFKRAGVVHVGDLFHGFADPAPGDDMKGLARTLGELLERLPPDTTIVTGHGPVTDVDELARHRRMLLDTIAWAEAAIAAGASLDDLQRRPLPAPWDTQWEGPERARAMWLEAIHRSLTERPPSDRDDLLRLHREGIEAHLERDVDKLMEAEAPDTVYASGGRIRRPSLAERRAMFDGYFGSTQFEVYRDVVEPVVKVSADGTLGWVIAEVEVRGTQAADTGPLEIAFRSSWIELYEKRDGTWRRIGNVSNVVDLDGAS